MSLITPRRGRAIDRLAVEHYGAYHVGEYRGSRDAWLIAARSSPGGDLRAQRIRHAINLHRSMMRCLRELKRERDMERKLQELNKARVVREWSAA